MLLDLVKGSCTVLNSALPPASDGQPTTSQVVQNKLFPQEKFSRSSDPASLTPKSQRQRSITLRVSSIQYSLEDLLTDMNYSIASGSWTINTE
jgi:hypothetical protein